MNTYYQIFNETPCITTKQWEMCGLTYWQLNHDSKNNMLRIADRRINGNTLIDVRSIQRPERREAIEKVFGKIDRATDSIYKITTDETARTEFEKYIDANGNELSVGDITKYTQISSVWNAMRAGRREQINALTGKGERLVENVFYSHRLQWWNDTAVEWNKAHSQEAMPIYSNLRSFERAFKRYCNEGYMSLVRGKSDNQLDNARKVSDKTEKLLLALWTASNKPYKTEVHKLYHDFINGTKEFYDKTTGEVFMPEEFRHKGRPLEISVPTIWNYLKKHINDAAMAAKRDGNYLAVVEKRPYHFRKSPEFSLSKISMDDADLSRKIKGGDRAHRYMAFDVMSGYWFEPVYSRDALTTADVMQCFRNMFCELEQMGLPMPGEVEHEHHLMDSIMTDEFKRLFPFVTASSHSRNKRSEHGINSLKWGVAHKNDHTRGRFYGKGAYRTPRFRAKGEFTEKEYEFEQIVTDDLNDINEHNNSLHPLQKKYPNMTRKQVFLAKINQNLQRLQPRYLYKFIGNETETSLRNNNHLQVNYEMFLIDDYKMLERMKPGDISLTAYWLPDANGEVGKVYLYQGETYIGAATNKKEFVYNESKFETTEKDIENRLKQDKRLANFDKMLREVRSDLPKYGIIEKGAFAEITELPVEVVEQITENQWEQEEEYSEDYAGMALASL